MDDVLLEANEDPTLVLRQMHQREIAEERGKNASADHSIDGSQPIRLVCYRDLPDVINLEIDDYVEFHVVNGELIIRKKTKKYSGFDFEGEEIHENRLNLEKSKADNSRTSTSI